MEREDFVTRLYIQYESALIKSCRRYVRYDSRYLDLVEDCVQETFLLLFQRYNELQNHPYIGRWLYVTCINKLKNALYKCRVRENRAAFSMDEHPNMPVCDAQTAVERWLEKDASVECISRILKTLTAKESEIFEDYFIEGLTAKEIAYRRGITLTSVKSILHKIRLKGRSEKLDGFILLLGILSRFR